jgi:uncharacterized protein YcgI (DUF1989 family)
MTNRELTVEAGHGLTFEVRKGQTLTIIDSEGRQAADFVAIINDGTGTRLSPVHTRRQLQSLFFATGDCLYSENGEPLLTILEDTVGIHDANVPACDHTRYSVDFGIEGHRNCLDNLYEGLQAYLSSPLKVGEPFNLFQNGPVTSEGKMMVTDPLSKPGDRIVFEVLQDLVCAVSSCPQDIIPGNGLQVTPIGIRIEGH